MKHTLDTLVQTIKGIILLLCGEMVTTLILDTYPSEHLLSKEQLWEVIEPNLPSSYWPGDEDVKRAFHVFDSEGLGFIKVTLLKRFLVQSQLGVEDAVCESLSNTIHTSSSLTHYDNSGAGHQRTLSY